MPALPRSMDTYIVPNHTYTEAVNGNARPQDRVPRPGDAQAGAGDPRPAQRVRGDPRGARAGRLSDEGDEGLRPRRRERPRLRGRVAAAVSSRLVFDTSVYIAILRDGRFAASFRERYRRDVPRTHMCSVVVQELLAGARTARHRRLAAALYEPFERARRIVVPTHRVWKHAGMVLSMLWNRLPAVRSRVARGLVNDALIALTARSIGAAVVTRNERDFRLIRGIRPFDLEIV